MRRSSNPKALLVATFFVCLALAASAQPPKAGVRKAPAKSAKPASIGEPQTNAAQSALPTIPVAHLESSLGIKVKAEWPVENDEGKIVPLGNFLPKSGLAVLIFLSPRDPATQAAAERIDKLADEFSPKKAKFIGISINRNESLQELKVLDEKLDWNFPLVRDLRQTVAKNLKARFTPEVFVVQSGVVKYAGPIDDCWYDARQVRASYLRQVLETLLKGGKLPQIEPTNYGGRAIE